MVFPWVEANCHGIHHKSRPPVRLSCWLLLFSWFYYLWPVYTFVFTNQPLDWYRLHSTTYLRCRNNRTIQNIYIYICTSRVIKTIEWEGEQITHDASLLVEDVVSPTMSGVAKCVSADIKCEIVHINTPLGIFKPI